MKKAAVRKGLVVISALVFLGTPHLVVAGSPLAPPVPPQFNRPGGDLFPLEVLAYPSRDAARVGIPAIREERAPTRGGSLTSGADGLTAGLRLDEGESSSRKKYVPVLLSFLVPGTGEIYMGRYVRGAVLLAAEAAAWTGYIHYHEKGLDSRVDYERFADAHWGYERWYMNHPATAGIEPPEARTFEVLDEIGRNEWQNQWPGYHIFYDKNEEKQNYYETIGKYDWFISGWEDWDPEADPLARDTDRRTTYRSMRKTSNDELDTAHSFIYLSIAARVVSLVDTILLTRRGDSGSSNENAAPGFSINARATGLASGEIALVYRFR